MKVICISGLVKLFEGLVRPISLSNRRNRGIIRHGALAVICLSGFALSLSLSLSLSSSLLFFLVSFSIHHHHLAWARVYQWILAMEASSSQPPEASDETGSKFLIDFPSRGFLSSSTVVSSNPGSLRATFVSMTHLPQQSFHLLSG
ncbi:PREDICTED: uncharacterized protein LOC104726976 [Camelina sativa]|uniref:Uncharacterized protein LOC104726976 n=1 Tax=Camelina sativa TaxID=90675 RepID=A0ABM1QNP9_CAMSA|nr:PREDICTED: uncharacterized protein LOC104726976 [Camelina sativa]XP_019088387.1 PREDICTED: uncharacterized protein LOC104726976 [Camelina sativa]